MFSAWRQLLARKERERTHPRRNRPPSASSPNHHHPPSPPSLRRRHADRTPCDDPASTRPLHPPRHDGGPTPPARLPPGVANAWRALEAAWAAVPRRGLKARDVPWPPSSEGEREEWGEGRGQGIGGERGDGFSSLMLLKTNIRQQTTRDPGLTPPSTPPSPRMHPHHSHRHADPCCRCCDGGGHAAAPSVCAAVGVAHRLCALPPRQAGTPAGGCGQRCRGGRVGAGGGAGGGRDGGVGEGEGEVWGEVSEKGE